MKLLHNAVLTLRSMVFSVKKQMFSTLFNPIKPTNNFSLGLRSTPPLLYKILFNKNYIKNARFQMRLNS